MFGHKFITTIGLLANDTMVGANIDGSILYYDPLFCMDTVASWNSFLSVSEVYNPFGYSKSFHYLISYTKP